MTLSSRQAPDKPIGIILTKIGIKSVMAMGTGSYMIPKFIFWSACAIDSRGGVTMSRISVRSRVPSNDVSCNEYSHQHRQDLENGGGQV